MPFLSYFDDVKAQDEELAQLILDFLTEIWMYELALYSTIDHAKKSYNLMRSEVEVLNDL